MPPGEKSAPRSATSEGSELCTPGSNGGDSSESSEEARRAEAGVHSASSYGAGAGLDAGELPAAITNRLTSLEPPQSKELRRRLMADATMSSGAVLLSPSLCLHC